MFRFLVTTDNHLGYKERDNRQGMDSFISFEECLKAARSDFDVDAVLLGGDLFHDNKPSLGTMNRSMQLLRKYVMGSKAIDFAIVSDPAEAFPRHPFPCANFQDPNSNVALPIFTINGNHDDPASGYSSLDLLASAGLINYFGHVDNLEDIVVRPILLQKGSTQIALYGLCNVRDERLHRCFDYDKVKFVQPKDNPEKWFKILILHQNRGTRAQNSKNGITEAMLAKHDLDLIIWGNEHEQEIIPQPSGFHFDVMQPGSTIHTSLGGSESNPKKFGILEVREKDYRVTGYPLVSVRPVVRRTIELWKEAPAKTQQAVEDYLHSITEEMLDEGQKKIDALPAAVLRVHPNLRYPLMRLAVDFSDPDGPSYPMPNVNRFGQQFLDVVVNAEDVLKPIKQQNTARARTAAANRDVSRDVELVPEQPGVSVSDIRTKIAQVFNANAKDACNLLSESEVSSAVYSFVEKSDTTAIETKIETLLKDSQSAMWKQIRSKGIDDVDRDCVMHLAVEHKSVTNKKFARIRGEDTEGTEVSNGVSALGGPSGVSVPLGAPLPRSHVDLQAQSDAMDILQASRMAERNSAAVNSNVPVVAVDPMPAHVPEELPGDDVEVIEAPPAATASRGTKSTGTKRKRKDKGEDLPKVKNKAEAAAPQLALSTTTGGGGIGGVTGASGSAQVIAKW